MRLIIIAFIWTIFTFNCLAQEGPLSGLTGIKVFVYTTPNIKDAGIKVKDMETEIELILRENNINILSKDEYKAQGAALNIWVRGYYDNSVYGNRHSYFCITTLEIEEYATLLRSNTKPDKPKIHLVRTWETSSIILGPHDNMKESTLKSMKAAMEEFSNEYLKANQ